MLENIKQIAERIKGLRETSDISAESMAKTLNISIEKYNEYESGEVDIPVSFLYEMAAKFNIELTALLTGGEPHLQKIAVVRKDKGLSIARRKEYKYQDLAFNFKNKKAEIFSVKVEPSQEKKENVSKYAHKGHEFNYILEGKMRFFYRNEEYLLEPGDSMYFDSSCEHAMQAVGDKDLKFLAIIFQA